MRSYSSRLLRCACWRKPSGHSNFLCSFKIDSMSFRVSAARDFSGMGFLVVITLQKNKHIVDSTGLILQGKTSESPAPWTAGLWITACGRLTAFVHTRATEIFRLNAPRITVVGSYATGLTMRVDRLPSLGETLLGSGYRVDHGGKGSNQAVGCARLGAKVSFVAKIGKDSFGESALALYRDERVDVTHVSQTADAPTGVGFIVVEAASGNNCIVIDPGANDLLTAADVS